MNKIFALVILLSLTVVGCTKEGEISDDIQPDKDKLQVYKVDTISYDVTTFSPDSILSSGLTNFMFGGYRDDVFGLTKGHFVSQLRFDQISYLDTISTSDSLVLDSLFFIIPYTNYIGDSLLANEVTLYELQKPIDNYTNYYSNYDLESAYDKNEPLGNLYYRVKSDENIVDYYTSNGDPIYGLKVPLTMDLAQRLIDNVDLYKNDLSAFQDFFKGIVAVSTFGSKSLVMVNPLLTDSYFGVEYKCRMLLHYHDTREASIDTVMVLNTDSIRVPGSDSVLITVDTTYSYPVVQKEREQAFYVNNECGRFSVLEHDFSGAEIESGIVNEPSFPYGFVRGGGGLRLRIKMPKFREHASFQPLEGQDTARIAINSAKLRMKVDVDAINVNKISPPSSVVALVDNGEEIDLIPDLRYGSSYFDGDLNYFTFTYEINIGEYVQNSINLKDTEQQDDIIISVKGDAVNPFFTLLGKPNHPDVNKQMTFEVVYTRY